MGAGLLKPSVAAWIAPFIREQWAGPIVVSKGRLHDTRKLPGIVAIEGTKRLGLLLFSHEGQEIGVVTLHAFERRRGVGRFLLRAMLDHAVRCRVTRVWLITTNDNVDAVAFYTRCGFRLVRVGLDAITAARTLKPEIPLIGSGGVLICDELEFEKRIPDFSPDDRLLTAAATDWRRPDRAGGFTQLETRFDSPNRSESVPIREIRGFSYSV